MAETRNKDYAERETDKAIEELEDRIYRIYKQAYEEARDKFIKKGQDFNEKDKIKRKEFESGKITEEEYINWRKGQSFITERLNQIANELGEDLVHADQIALSVANGYMPDVYAMNFNYQTYDVEQSTQIDTSFTLYSRESVERLEKGGRKILPKRKVDVPKDKKWNVQHLRNEIMQGILQGKSIPDIAKGLRNVTDMDRRASIRNARTMMTGAQNGGRLDAMKRASDLGIRVQKEWMATLDDRTRDSHQRLDGERKNLGELFSNGCVKPGDPNGAPEEVYNCRCTMVAFYPEYANIISDRITYKEWAKNKENKDEKGIKTSYDVGLKPKRPKFDDYGFDRYEEWQKAREEYKEKYNEWENRVNEYVANSLPKKSMSFEEFENWCNKNNCYIDERVPKEDWSELDGRAFTLLTKRYEELFDKFPFVQEHAKHRRWKGKYNISYDKTALYTAEASSGFTFGPSFKNVERLLRDEATRDDDMDFVRGDGTLNRVLDHEFGHNVFDALEYTFKDWDKYGGLTLESLDKIGNFEKDFFESVYGKDGMSRYATTNHYELFAEAFSAWYGGEKTEFAKAMGSFLKKYGVTK